MSPFLFYLKHGSQLSTLAAQGKSQSGHIVTDVLVALAPVIKAHWPQLDQDELIDDTIAMLKGMLQ